MTNIDQFESVFKSATKEAFAWEDLKIQRVAVVTDGDRALADQVADRVQRMVDGLPVLAAAEWHVLTNEDYASVEQLLQMIGQLQNSVNLHVPQPECPRDQVSLHVGHVRRQFDAGHSAPSALAATPR